jgi:hypothetical protein
MLTLTDIGSVSAALGDQSLDVDLRALIGFRVWHMCVEHECAIGTEVQIFVVQGGDTPEVINATIGFPITGAKPEDPSFISIEAHGLWYELAYARDHDPHTRIFVENGPATELGIHAMCLGHFWPGDEDEG